MESEYRDQCFFECKTESCEFYEDGICIYNPTREQLKSGWVTKRDCDDYESPVDEPGTYERLIEHLAWLESRCSNNDKEKKDVKEIR